MDNIKRTGTKVKLTLSIYCNESECPLHYSVRIFVYNRTLRRISHSANRADRNTLNAVSSVLPDARVFLVMAQLVSKK